MMALETEVRLTWLWLVIVWTAAAWQWSPGAAMVVAFAGYNFTAWVHDRQRRKDQ